MPEKKSELASAVKNFASNVSNGVKKALDKIGGFFSSLATPKTTQQDVKTPALENKQNAQEKFDELKALANRLGLMGKKYVSYEDAKGKISNTFVCTTFVQQILTAAGMNFNNYMPSLNTVESMKTLEKHGGSGLFETEAGKNPGEGVYIFYKKYDNGTGGHVGFAKFDAKGNVQVLHNGWQPGTDNENVNSFVRDKRDFDTWFTKNQKHRIQYMRLDY